MQGSVSDTLIKPISFFVLAMPSYIRRLTQTALHVQLHGRKWRLPGPATAAMSASERWVSAGFELRFELTNYVMPRRSRHCEICLHCLGKSSKRILKVLLATLVH